MSLTYVNSPKDWVQPPYSKPAERIPADRPKHDPSANVQVPVVLPSPIVPSYDGYGALNRRRGLSAGQAAAATNIPAYEEEMDIIIDSIFDPWVNKATSHPSQVPVLAGMHEVKKEEKPTLFSPWEQKELKTETLPVTSTGIIPAMVQQPIGEMTEIEFKNLIKSEGESMATNDFQQENAIITEQQVLEPILPGSFPKEKMSTPSAVERKAKVAKAKQPKKPKSAGIVKPEAKVIQDRALKEKKAKTANPKTTKRKAEDELVHKLKSKKLNPEEPKIKKRKASTQLTPTATEKKATAKVKKAPPPKIAVKELPVSKQSGTKAKGARAAKGSTVSKTPALNKPKTSDRKKTAATSK